MILQVDAYLYSQIKTHFTCDPDINICQIQSRRDKKGGIFGHNLFGIFLSLSPTLET